MTRKREIQLWNLYHIWQNHLSCKCLHNILTSLLTSVLFCSFGIRIPLDWAFTKCLFRNSHWARTVTITTFIAILSCRRADLSRYGQYLLWTAPMHASVTYHAQCEEHKNGLDRPPLSHRYSGLHLAPSSDALRNWLKSWHGSRSSIGHEDLPCSIHRRWVRRFG